LLKDKKGFKIFLSIGILIIPVAMYFVPLEWLKSQHSICLFRNLTGHECWGCGMTRAMFSAIHLRFYDALNFNRLSLVVLPLLIYIWAKTILSLLPGPGFFMGTKGK
jgi:hypothetical protein